MIKLQLAELEKISAQAQSIRERVRLSQECRSSVLQTPASEPITVRARSLQCLPPRTRSPPSPSSTTWRRSSPYGQPALRQATAHTRFQYLGSANVSPLPAPPGIQVDINPAQVLADLNALGTIKRAS